MSWQRAHARAKSAFLSARDWRERYLTRVRSQWSQFMLREVNSWSRWVDLPPTQRLRNLRDGFLSHSAALYDFDSYGRAAYLSDIQRERTAFINKPEFSRVLANKVGFYLAMEQFDEHRPETFGVIADGQFHPVSTTRQLPADESSQPADAVGQTVPATSTAAADDETGAVDAATWVCAQLDAGTQLVLKPVHDAGGTGVKRVALEDGRYSVNGEPTSRAELRQMVSTLSNAVAMELVEQAAYARRLFPAATNTIRVLTMWDAERQEVFSPAVTHRIGTSHSAPVDNFDRAGLSAAVDHETGELDTAIQLAADGTVRHCDSHPETDRQIASQQIPGWARIIDRLRDIARAFSYIPYVGWDIVVTGPGEFVLLEANNCPGVKSLQAHEPLLTDDRTRRFYEAHNVCP